MRERWRIEPGTTVDLGAIDPAGTPGAPGDKAVTLATLPALRLELADWQLKLSAQQSCALLLVLQAMDSGGKDGTIRHVFDGVNPQGTRVHSFKAPAGDERLHDFLWRVHGCMPAAGEIGIFNRSHYEDVLVARVARLVPEAVWKRRFRFINDFEAMAVAEGTTVVKVFLHISFEEQRRRLQARLDDPDKRWKFRPEDLQAREHWDDYQTAYTDVLRRTSTEAAPWFVIPADHKWYRNWAVSQILIHTLAAMDPHYPQPVESLPDRIP